MRETHGFKRMGRAALACVVSGVLAIGSPMAAFAATKSELEQQVQQAQDRLASLNTEAELCQYDLINVTADLNQTEEHIKELDVLIPQTTDRLAQAQQSYATFARNDYKRGSVSLLDVVLQAASFEELVERVEYANKVAESEHKVIENVRTYANDLSQQKAELEVEKANKERLVDEQRDKLKAVNDAAAEAQDYYDDLSDELKDKIAEEEAAAAKRAIEEAQAAAAEAQRQADREAEEQRKREAEEQRKREEAEQKKREAEEQKKLEEQRQREEEEQRQREAQQSNDDENQEQESNPSEPVFPTPEPPSQPEDSPAPAPAPEEQPAPQRQEPAEPAPIPQEPEEQETEPAPLPEPEEDENVERDEQENERPRGKTEDEEDDAKDEDEEESESVTPTGSTSSLVARAYSIIGSGYQWSGYDWNGSTSSSSFTCSGVVDYALGLPSQSNSPETLYAAVGSSLVTDTSQLQYGDLVFYSYAGRYPGHVGIYVGGGQIIDSIPNGGVAVRDVNYMPCMGGGPIL